MAPGSPSPRPSPAPFRPRRPVVIGITGGIASGKSTVARLFAGHGIAVVDADAVARDVAAEPEVLAEVEAAFGPSVLRDGAFDRAELARRIFEDPAARARLEAITHPRIRARILEALARHRDEGRSVVLDAPLLLETGLVHSCDATVYVEASPAVRARRAASRGWDADELKRREASQLPVSVKRERALRIIENDGDLDRTARDVAEALDALADLP